MRPETRLLLASKPGGKGEETVAAMVVKMTGAIVEVVLSVDSWEARVWTTGGGVLEPADNDCFELLAGGTMAVGLLGAS
jgi:hypothetical protein